jgi:hypothetical protein
MEMGRRLKEFWDITEGEDNMVLANSLFDEIILILMTRELLISSSNAWY